MQLIELFPILSILGFAGFVIMYTAKGGAIGGLSWRGPAILSLAFLIFSLFPVFIEGPLGFWENHNQDLWGNQVWFDLLIAFAIGWSFLLPAALRLGMNRWVWMLLLFFTGCIGLLAMYARVLYLQEQQQAAA